MMIQKTNTYILLVFLFIGSVLNAQTKEEQIEMHKQNTGKHLCATPEMTKEQNKAFLESPKAILKTTGYTQLPVRIHIVTLNNGTGGISLNDINQAMANLNFVYQQENIEFFIADVNYIANTTYYEFSQSEENALCSGEEVFDAVNVFFVNSITTNSGGGACGYARYPSNNTVTLRILMDNGCTVGNVNGTFVHEFGHFFNLPHTHNGTSNGNSSSNAEHVPRSGANSNCDTDGDFICDTEADPTGSTASCVYTGGGQDIFGNDYTPNVDNIMSYYSDNCGGIFTPGQYTRVAAGLATRLAHTVYDVDGAAPLNNADPSNLTASVLGTGVILNWLDNASDEFGYLIERSDDGGTTYHPLEFGGVAPNVTTFSNGDLTEFTTYWYRVKASSDNPDHYSNAVSITTEGTNYVCADALTISSCGSFGSSAPNQGGGANNSNATNAIWYKFDPPYSGTVDIYACLSGVDTRLWVYSGSCGSLTLIANNDDECEMTPGSNAYASEVLAVSVTKDVPIYIEWDDRWSQNAFTFYIDLNVVDVCAEAEDLTAEGTYSVDNISCGEGAIQGDATHATFFKFTPPTTGNITIASCDEGVNTRLWIHSGTCGSLTNTHSSDDDCSAGSGLGNIASSISNIPVVASVPIYIEWDDRWSSQGFDFDITYQGGGGCPTDISLSGDQLVSDDFETNGEIISTQSIQAGITVDYDSGTSITLNPGFETIFTAIFEAFIDGCGGAH